MWEVFQDGESLVAYVEVGYCFIVVTNDDIEAFGVGFWILMCTERLHTVTLERHVNVYGQMFIYGSQIVIGKYFEQQGRSSYSYVQCDKGEVYVYSRLIRVVKFQMV